MESSWPMKCGPALQSSASVVASSASSDLGNQVEVNAGQYFYPHARQDLRSQMQGRMPDPSFSSCNVVQGDNGNSFLGSLSGTPSLLQCDFQELSNPKPFGSSYKLPSQAGSMHFNGIASGIPLSSTGILPENSSYQNLRIGAEMHSGVLPKAAVGSNSSCSSVLQYTYANTNCKFDSSNMAKAVSHPMVSFNERVKDFPSLRGGWHNTTSASTGKLQTTNVQLPQKMPSESESFFPNDTSSFSSSCPRVFCMGKSGDLLLSNTGLLGILCSCHCFHMSVSKFCEHSGLRNINAGDAVRMESGETIAQWRKLYFQKFGIRVPEDQSGWDWPDGLSLTASLIKSGISVPVAVSNISKKSDLNNVVGLSGCLERHRQPVYDTLLPENPLTDDNSVVDALQNKQKKNGLDGDMFLLKGLLRTSQSNPCTLGDNQLMYQPSSRCSVIANAVTQGLENVGQSLSANIDATLKSGCLSTNCHTLQNRRTLVKSSNVRRSEDAKDSVSMEKDAASSTIELRLGQPYHQNQSQGNPLLSSLGQWLHSTAVDRQKPISMEQRTRSASIFKWEEARQILPHGNELFDSISRKEQHQLNYRNSAIKRTMDAAKVEKANLARNPAVSSLRQFNALPEGCSESNVVNISEHFIPEAIHGESPIVKGSPVSIPWNGSNFLERHPQLSFVNSTDKGKSVECNAGNCCTEKVSLSKMHNWVQNSSPFKGFLSRNSYSDNGCFHFSSVQDVCDPRNFSNCHEKVSCFGSSGCADHMVHKSMVSPKGSAQILQSQASRTDFCSSPSNCIPEPTPALFQQESSGSGHHLLDDNLRVLALRQILESKQQHVMSSLGKNLEQGTCNNSSDAKVFHSLIGLSSSGEMISMWKDDACDISMKPIQPCSFSSKIGNSVDAFTYLSGLNKRHDSSSLTQGVSLNSKENDLQHQQPPLMLGRNEKGIANSNKNDSCFQRTFYIQENCGCAVHAKCLGDQCRFRTGNAPTPFREPIGSTSGEAPLFVAADLVKDYSAPKETVTSANQCGKLQGDVTKNSSFLAYKWKDVPSKGKGVSEVESTKPSAVALDRRGNESGQPRDNAPKSSNTLLHVGDSSIEQETSNISSGCSAPAVTHASVEFKNMESSTTIAGNVGDASNPIFDEGSGIDKCWSSDDLLESDKSANCCDSTCMTRLQTEKSVNYVNDQPSRSLLDEVKLMNSLTWKKGSKQIHNSIAIDGKSNVSQELKLGFKNVKRKREMSLNMLDASLSNEGPVISNKISGYNGTAETNHLPKGEPCSKRVKSTSSSTKLQSRKRDLNRIYYEKDMEDDHKIETNVALTSEVPTKKKFRNKISDGGKKFHTLQTAETIGEEAMKRNSDCKDPPSSHQLSCYWKARPVVCGKYGEIANGNVVADIPKPAKIVSLERIMEIAKRCTTPQKCKSRPKILREWKRTNYGWSNACYDKLSIVKRIEENGNNNALSINEINHDVEEQEEASSSEDNQFDDEFSQENQKDDAQSKPKFREIRKRSLYELTLTGKNPSCQMLPAKKIFHNTRNIKECRILENKGESKCYISGSCEGKAKSFVEAQEHLCVVNSDSICCVCGSSNQDDSNCLLNCSQCSIKVHQACYGILKVPKGHWYCRPCRTHSKNIACVLCGYGGGAMTRALQSSNIVKSLLKAWSHEADCTAKNAVSSSEAMQSSILHSLGSMKSVKIEPSISAAWVKDVQNQLGTFEISLSSISKLKMHNSITAGVLDSTVKQWVHMVCGLWTPGTRCPNVDTMSAFDVSGASRPRANVVCSICNRPGGSCIQCRVVNCSVQFHPWCAYQKGLLQSEVEGVDNENVGFYGRCMLHGTYQTNEYAHDATNNRTDCPAEKEESCARTEGYKGRKRDGFWHTLDDQSKGKSGCLVPQEQLNAWTHINGQKSCTQGLPKLPMSEMEYDCRKEYTRYKQAKGWKHLVVYKSGIHALGLYTSRFISRGEMVVEYVGEIVGLRVADKRENEYISGRKVQYKSACYFFRIDKEHIIDATRKGGIARFVNHSCQPNCVAKVISVRNEKKVVFLAERDVYPGEEITYDYHFNHEDEGKKIPCFCNSKNCRRYLN